MYQISSSNMESNICRYIMLTTSLPCINCQVVTYSKGPFIYKVTGGGRGIYGGHFKNICLLGGSTDKNWKSLSALGKIPHKTIEKHP